MVWFAFWLAKYGMHQEFNTYKLSMKESVAGLSKDSIVRLHGVDVGRVSQIRIDPNNIEQIDVFVKIKKDVPIKEDMVAHTQMLGVTGLLSIEIDGGSNQAKTLQSTQAHIAEIPTVPSWLNKTKNGLGSLSSNMNDLLQRTQRLLSDENLATFSELLTHTNEVTAKAIVLEDKAVSSLDEVDRTLIALQDSLQSMNQRIVEASKEFKMMQESFSSVKKVTIPAIKTFEKTTKNFNRVTLKFERSLNRGDYNVKKIFEPMLVDMEILFDNLNSFTQELEQNPSGLLFKSRKERHAPGE
jgi:phospholipid/cholesterol/gamma-HCH transport system substrate-binding protein